MLPSKYIKVSYFWPSSAKKIFLCVTGVQKTEKNLKKNDFFFIKPIPCIIHVQHLEFLRSLRKAPETKT